jgi:hypothetical protein
MQARHEGASMVDYRIYSLDGAGRIGFAEWLVADDDEAAVSEARRMRPDAHRCEVWDRNRLVATLDDGAAGLTSGDGSGDEWIASVLPTQTPDGLSST